MDLDGFRRPSYAKNDSNCGVDGSGQNRMHTWKRCWSHAGAAGASGRGCLHPGYIYRRSPPFEQRWAGTAAEPPPTLIHMKVGPKPK